MKQIQIFMNTQSWNYTADSNPCIACHNPHKTKGDPANNPTGLKTNAARGWPLSRPSEHKTTKASGTWQLWGDDAGEKMNAVYSGQYYEPFRSGKSTYEPDGASTQAIGTTSVNMVALCTDCHNSSNSIFSTELGTLRTIDWANEKHGAGNDGSALHLRTPYLTGPANKVLSCADCHEPHGAPNTTLIRGGVNGGTLSAISLNPLSVSRCINTDTDYSNKEMATLCIQCHQDDVTANPGGCAGQTNRYYYIHHDAASGDAPFPSPGAGTCVAATCHSGTNGAASCTTLTVNPINCTCCHTHNSTWTTPARRTF
jgi:hypothetical protein